MRDPGVSALGAQSPDLWRLVAVGAKTTPEPAHAARPVREQSTGRTRVPEKGIDLGGRLALRLNEAAEALGVSEGAFRAHLLPRCPKFYVGRSLRIPRDLFERFVGELAQEEDQDSAAAQTILDRVSLDKNI